MTYEVKIILFNEVEYKGIMTIENGKLYIRSLIDLDNYENMFQKLYEDGYVKVYENDNIEVIKFNSLEEMFGFLKEDFDLEYEIIDDKYLFSVVADGKDLHPNTIAMKKEGMKLYELTISLYNYANKNNYEPKIEVYASSFGVGIQESDGNNEELINIINQINSNNFLDLDKFFKDLRYKKLINSLIEVVSIKTLDNLFIKIGNRKIHINLKAINKLKENFDYQLKNKKISVLIEKPQEQLRAFDKKNLRVILDYELFGKSWFSLHFDDSNVFNKLLEMYNDNTSITIEGFLKKVQTIEVKKVFS